MATLTSKMDTHDKDIKSTITTTQNTITNAINAKGCVKNVQRIFKENFKINVTSVNNGKNYCSLSIPISDINLSKSILLVNNCVFEPLKIVSTGDAINFVKCTLQSSSILLESSTDISSWTIYFFEAQVVEFY